jgi:hypothetical protein
MSRHVRWTLAVVLLSFASNAFADGIEPGFWKLTTWVEDRGVIGPPQQSAKCLKAEETRDLATTFSPIARTINSDCAPLERNFDGTKLSWKLVCKGQLDMEVTGDFVFSDPHRYVATVLSKAAMAGMQMANTRTMTEAEWVSSQCP